MVTPWGFESPLSHQTSGAPMGAARMFFCEREGARKAGRSEAEGGPRDSGAAGVLSRGKSEA